MTEQNAGRVSLRGVSKVYADGTRAVDKVNLEIEPGEFVIMVGPSGCGKSTSLRMLAGLEEISEGEIVLDGEVINDLGPGDRDIAMVFQDYALYPHMTVEQNIGFALKLAKVPKDERKKMVHEAARVLELTDLLHRKPGRLSGGQRQRVAMGRAIVRRPKLFLLDEPLSNLDAKLRVQMRGEISEIQNRLGITTFYVTHDQVEAMTMADRVAVIDRGVLQQFAAPQEIFERPANMFVAAFTGSPAMNLLEGKLQSRHSKTVLTVGSSEVELPAEYLSRNPRIRTYLEETIAVGIRPKDLQLTGQAPEPHLLGFKGELESVEMLGFETVVYLGVDATPARSAAATRTDEEEIGSRLSSGAAARLAARVEADAKPKVGEGATLAVDIEKLRFFDLSDGLAIYG